MESDSLTPWLLAIKVTLYVAALLASGISLHVSFGIIEPEERRRAMIHAAAFAVAALVFTGAKLLVINAQLGGGMETALDPSSFAWTWRAQGYAALAAFFGVAAIVIADSLGIAWIAGIGATGIALSFALTGHSQALEPPGLTPWGVALHVLIAGFWVAAPLTLWPRKNLSDTVLVARLERFSAIALIVVPILFALGLWLAWRLAGGVQELITSEYGRALLFKLAIASVALGLGGLNKLVTTPILIRDPGRGRRLLERSLIVEAAMFCAAIMIVGWATTMTGPLSILTTE